MADILIRGMEMPTHDALLNIRADGRAVLYPFCVLDKVIEYEAVELPEHGDLIDMDEIIEQIAETPFTMSMFQTVKECRAAINAKEVILNVVAYADAVIPSNKEETKSCLEAWHIVAPLIVEHMNRIPHESGQLNALDEAYVRVCGACIKQDEREKEDAE